MDIQNFFIEPTSPAQKQYEALRAFFLDKKPAADVTAQFGYTLTALYSLTRDFRKRLNNDNAQPRRILHATLRRFFGNIETEMSEKAQLIDNKCAF